jgi:3-hydroxyacyl-[acyl-carrier-protein] dehydratase
MSEVALDAMDIQKIQSLLPHRYPFLMIDRVLEAEAGTRLVAIKNVTINEPFFQGHFPGKPVMPGVLLIEAMAQATGLLAMESADVPKEAIYYLVGVDKARFKRPVVPGDQLVFEVEVLKRKREIWVFAAEVKVDGAMVASAEIMCTARNL